MFYPFRVNSALLQINVNPNNISGEYRRQVQQLGKKLGYTPQETALLIVSQIPLGHNYRINKINLTGWVNTGKCRLSIQEISEAHHKVMSEFQEDPRF